MEQTSDLTPALSVILPALGGYESVQAALDAWESQTCRERFEIIVLCPTSPNGSVPRGQVIVETRSLMLHEARAAGIRMARADHILLAEDHCLPDPDCAEVILERLSEGWDAVGPALRPGVPGSVSYGSFLISYAQWLLPASGAVEHLPGHNAVMRRAPLIRMGSELENELISAMFLMQHLRRGGGRFFVEERARMRHFDVPDWRASLGIFFAVGKGCGAVRLKDASRLSRALYSVTTPVIAARHFARGLIHYARAGRRAGFDIQSVAAGALFSVAWGLGEVAGAWKGLDAVTPGLWVSEVKPVTVEQANKCPREQRRT